MDKWKDDEVARMRVGGNARAAAFFREQPDFRDSWTFEEKYHSKAAGSIHTRMIFVLSDYSSAS